MARLPGRQAGNLEALVQRRIIARLAATAAKGARAAPVVNDKENMEFEPFDFIQLNFNTCFD